MDPTEEKQLTASKNVPDLVILETQRTVDDSFKGRALSLLEVATGALQTEKGELLGAVGRIAQGFVKGNLATTFTKEWGRLAEKGKIPPEEDLKNKTNFFQTLGQILSFLNEAPDEERFHAVKSLFFYYLSSYDEDIEEQAIYMMSIVKELNTSELKTLSAIYRLYLEENGSDARDSINRNKWLNDVAAKAGHKIVSRIERDEARLLESKLISKALSGGSRVDKRGFRLTDLGITLCSFLAKGDQLDQ